MQDDQPKLTVITQDQARQVNTFRKQVSELDPICQDEMEKQANSQVQRIRQIYRQEVDQGTTKPRAYTVMGAPGIAGAVIATELTQKMLNKRKASRASVVIPNAALNAAQHIQGQTEILTWVIEVLFTAGEAGAVLVRLQIHHKHKGKAKDPDNIQSYRPLGLADPLLSLLSDVLYTRITVHIATYVGSRQQGGQSDTRCMVILQRDARTARRNMQLPTAEISADARYGFDGGRHVQVLIQLHKANVTHDGASTHKTGQGNLSTTNQTAGRWHGTGIVIIITTAHAPHEDSTRQGGRGNTGCGC